MTRVVLIFGLLAGLIISALVWMTAALAERDLIRFERLEVVGYASMIIALSMVFFGIKSYRDNQGKGQLSFWKGVQVGALISVIAGGMYFVGALSYGIVSPGFEDTFMRKFTELKVSQLQAQGASQAEIEKRTAEVETMRVLFKNPVLFFLVCMMEILPVGLIVTLISAALLRKRELLVAQPA